MSQTTQPDLDAGYLTPIQVSVRTGIAKTTLFKWRKDGNGPRFRRTGDSAAYCAARSFGDLTAALRDFGLGADF